MIQSTGGVLSPYAAQQPQPQASTSSTAGASFAQMLEQAQEQATEETAPTTEAAPATAKSSSLFGSEGLGSIFLTSMLSGGMGDSGGMAGILSLILMFLFNDTGYGVKESTDAEGNRILYPKITDSRLRYGPDGQVDYGPIVDSALTRLGDPYSQPKAGQDDYTDCSYLTRWCYRELGIELPRTAAAQAKYCLDNGMTIDKSELQPGDLIFFSLQKNGRFMDVSHVAIYAGEGMMVDASSNYGQVVYRPVFDGGQVLYGRPRSV